LNYRGEGTVDVGILYTTNHLGTLTDWNIAGDANNGWTSAFDSWYESETDQLFLQFEIDYDTNINDPGYAKYRKEERCLVCMNVDENSELRNGDTGFAVCYNNEDGNVAT